MTPIYIISAQLPNGAFSKSDECFPSKQSALQKAKEHTIKSGQKTYVFEAIAMIELPKPEPIVTMKGD